jgi:hypothetical protein
MIGRPLGKTWPIFVLGVEPNRPFDHRSGTVKGLVMKLLDPLFNLLRPARSQPVTGQEGPSRRAASHETIHNRCLLYWSDGTGTKEVPATLLSVSLIEASLVAKELPPPGQSVWFRLENPVPTEWLEVDIAWMRPPHELGLKFRGSCPYDLFKAVAAGYDLTRHKGDPDRSAFDERYWR